MLLIVCIFTKHGTGTGIGIHRPEPGGYGKILRDHRQDDTIAVSGIGKILRPIDPSTVK